MCSSREHVNHGRIRVFHGIIDTIHSTAYCLEAFSMCQYLHRLHGFLFGQVLAAEKHSRCLNTSGGTAAAERQPLLETQKHEAPVLRGSSGGMVAVQCLCGRNTTWLEGKKPRSMLASPIRADTRTQPLSEIGSKIPPSFPPGKCPVNRSREQSQRSQSNMIGQGDRWAPSTNSRNKNKSGGGRVTQVAS